MLDRRLLNPRINTAIQETKRGYQGSVWKATKLIKTELVKMQEENILPKDFNNMDQVV